MAMHPSTPQFGEPGYTGSDFSVEYQRWLRFASSVKACSTVSFMSRLLAYARDVQPDEPGTEKAFRVFNLYVRQIPNLPPVSTSTFARLPRSRLADSVALKPEVARAIHMALVDASMDGFPLRKDISGAIQSRNVAPIPVSQASPYKVYHPSEPDTAVATFHLARGPLLSELKTVCLEVLERYFNSGHPDMLPPEDSDDLDFL